MGFLKRLAPIEGGMFWGYREGTKIEPKIHDVVEHHCGRLVPIAGFDEVMLQLQEKLKLPFLLPGLQSVHDKRASDYQKQFAALTARLRKPAGDPVSEKARKPARKAAEAAVQRLTKEKNWWAWQLKADAESDPIMQESIYREAIEDFPESAELVGNFAGFVETVRKDYDEAERLYRKALEIDSNNVSNIANLACFVHAVRRDYAESERLHRMAVELDPNNARIVGNFARFVHYVWKDYDEAERLYRKALELDPNDAIIIANFATFMDHARKEYEEAEQLFREALELDPNDVYNICNFAQFLGARARLDEAFALAIRAWQLLDRVPGTIHAEIAFTRWLLDRASGRDGMPALSRLKTILHTGFLRANWSFEPLITSLIPRLAKEEKVYVRKLAAAILDEGEFRALESQRFWKMIKPTPLDVPWLS